MKSTFLSLFFCVLLFSVPFTQADDLDLGTLKEGYVPDEQTRDGGEPQYTEDQINEMQMEAQRLMLWGCYFFTKNLLFKTLDEVNQILASHPNNEILHQKIISDIMVDCITKATPYDLQDLVKNYGQEEFDLNKWSHMHTYSKEKYEKMGDLQTLTEQESVPFQYYDQIEKSIQEHMEKSGYPEGYNAQNDVQIFGFSLQKISDYMKVIFFTSLFALLGIAIYNKLTTPKPKLERGKLDEKAKLLKKKDVKEAKEGKEGKEEKEIKKEKGENEEKEEKKEKKDAKKKTE